MAISVGRTTSASAANFFRQQTQCAYKAGWMTWDDDGGIYGSNPQGDCGGVSRQDRAGISSSRPGMGFWTCATGACGYYSEFINGKTWEEATANPGLLEYVPFGPWLF